jgi:hypothetical protein
MHLYKAHAPVEPPRKECPQERRSRLNSSGDGWDCVRQMQMFRLRPDVLASALRDMGVDENGDEILGFPQ